MPSDALLTNTPREELNALTRRGFDPRKIVYLPVDKDPEYARAQAKEEAPEGSRVKEMNVTMGMTHRRQGDTWEQVATVLQEIGPEDRQTKVAVAMSEWINSNYSGEDQQWMQENAQYVNTWTINPGNPKNLNVVAHESTHQGIREASRHSGIPVNPTEDEYLARLVDLTTGSDDQKVNAQKYIDGLNDLFSLAISEEKMTKKDKENFLVNIKEKLQQLTTVAEQLEAGDLDE